MELLELPGWRIEFDRPATVAAHARSLCRGPERCGCAPCRNWAKTRDRLLPDDFRHLLQRIGIPLDGEAEVYHNGRLRNGRHSYGLWCHFVGRVLAGERDCAPNIETGTFSAFFHSKPALLADAFAGQSTVQLEVEAEVPWLSDVPEIV